MESLSTSIEVLFNKQYIELIFNILDYTSDPQLSTLFSILCTIDQSIGIEGVPGEPEGIEGRQDVSERILDHSASCFRVEFDAQTFSSPHGIYDGCDRCIRCGCWGRFAYPNLQRL